MEGLIDVMGLEVMAKRVRTGALSESWTERIPDLGAATLKLRATAGLSWWGPGVTLTWGH